MSFNVGLLEMIGYLAPGGVVVGAWLWLTGMLPLTPAGKLGGTEGVALALLASYVVGHLLTIVSSVLKPERPQNPYGHRQPFTTVFDKAFGIGLPRSATYHLARAVVIHHSSALGERIERYFALVILTRNLTVACGAVAIGLLLLSEMAPAALWSLTAVAFWYQHRRFVETEAKAVFGGAAVVLATRCESEVSPSAPAEHAKGSDPPGSAGSRKALPETPRKLVEGPSPSG